MVYWVWLKSKAVFNVPKSGVPEVFGAYTKCRLVRPTTEEKKQIAQMGGEHKIVVLGTMRRYMRKSNLMTEAMFNERRMELKRQGVLSKD